MALAQGKRGIGLGLGAILIAALLGALTVFGTGPQEPEPYDAAGIGPMTADELAEQFYRVAPELLTRVYLAFNETEEAAIYDLLAEVAAGGALEALYLERAGAMAQNGLDASEEADQQIHTMEMLNIRNRRNGEAFTWDARWRVVGTVGHATHMHVRGNIYAATLTVAPVAGAWRIEAFELTDVDRSEAGEMVAAPPEDISHDSPSTETGLTDNRAQSQP